MLQDLGIVRSGCWDSGSTGKSANKVAKQHESMQSVNGSLPRQLLQNTSRTRNPVDPFKVPAYTCSCYLNPQK